MKLSKNGFDLAKLVLKHYGKKEGEGTEGKDCCSHGGCGHEKEQNLETQSTSQAKPATQASTDYSYWSKVNASLPDEPKKRNLLEDGPDEAEESAKIWGCAQDHRKERDIYERSNAEKLKIIADYKKEGDEFFKQKKYSEADYSYQKAEVYLSYTIPDGDVETKNYDELELKVKLNICAVRLARGKYRDTIDYCEQIRRSDPNNLKATFRKATSHLELNEFDEAEKEIQRLQDLKGAAEDITILQNKLSSYKADLTRGRSKVGKAIIATTEPKQEDMNAMEHNVEKSNEQA